VESAYPEETGPRFPLLALRKMRSQLDSDVKHWTALAADSAARRDEALCDLNEVDAAIAALGRSRLVGERLVFEPE
jgi:alkylhydroperoxidase/carboxymuconolactone decarboxylase family protein YurZ